MRRLLREPLLHFLILGALLFALYGSLHRGMFDAPDVIVLSRAKLESLALQFTQVWQRPPTPAEVQGLIESFEREEVLYREGLALGFDRDDPVVKRRIGQQVEFLLEGEALPAPSAQELEAWLAAHADDYRTPPRYSLRQIYFDRERHGDRLSLEIAEAQEALARGESVGGDSTLLPASLSHVSASEIANIFGPEFAAALVGLTVGVSSGPVESPFGLHLVELTLRDDARFAALAEVRPAVERDLQHARAEDANAAAYAKLRAKYTVRIEGEGGKVGNSDGVADRTAGP